MSLKPWMLALPFIVLAGCGETNPGDKDAGGSTGRDAGTASSDAGLHDAGEAASCGRVAATSSDPESYQALLACLRGGEGEGAKASAIDGFLAAVEARGGFPIVTGSEAVFVYVRSARWDAEDDAREAEDFAPERRGEPLRVSGDFNAWGDDLVLQAEAGGLYHRSVPLTGTGAGQRYKLVARDGAGADVWFSDPLSRRFQFDENGRISLVRGGADRGHLEWIRAVRARQLGVERPIYLYVPRGYDGSTARYPVLYAHDGNNLFDVRQVRSAGATWDADAVADEEIAAGRVREFLLVGIPNNENRIGEYTHQPDRYQGQVMGGDGAGYLDFLVTDLKPLVDARYRTLPGREHSALLGSSLGGLISYYIGLERPEVFRYVGGMSSTFDWGGIELQNPTVTELWAAAGDLAGRDQVFYLDNGGGPGDPGPCLPDGADDVRDNYCETAEMRDLLVSRGVATFPDDPDASPLTPEDIDLYHWWEPGAPHSETAWSARLFRPLRLFFRP